MTVKLSIQKSRKFVSSSFIVLLCFILLNINETLFKINDLLCFNSAWQNSVSVSERLSLRGCVGIRGDEVFPHVTELPILECRIVRMQFFTVLCMLQYFSKIWFNIDTRINSFGL